MVGARYSALHESRAARLLLGCAVTINVLFVLWAIVKPEADALDWLFSGVLYNLGMATGGALCLLRARRVEAERSAWLLLGTSLIVWMLGNCWYWALLALGIEPPSFSIPDVAFISSYPIAGLGIIHLLRARMERFDAGAWLDGIIAGALVGGMLGVFLLDPVLRSATGSDGALGALNLLYPLADLLLIGLVAGAAAHRRWSTQGWGLLAVALALYAASDTQYMLRLAAADYHVGTLLDSGWILAALLIGWSAWRPVSAPRDPEHSAEPRVWVPALLGALAVATLLYATLGETSHKWLGVIFATASLLGMIARLTLTFAENQRMLRLAECEASTDSLTGLGNRRLLMRDLERETAAATDRRPLSVMYFDLDGFKRYNDTFGHGAGDALLGRLGSELAVAVGSCGRAYRTGGDEFCVLARPDGDGPLELAERARLALTSDGEGFAVGCSYGMSIVPDETRDPAEALRLADGRMYEGKEYDRRSREQAAGALLQAVRERNPELGDHSTGVTELAVAIARSLGLREREVGDVRLAAELHDIGKVAIPDAILNKPGPLDEAEWDFMHRHTVIGERIVEAAPALREVGRMVRSSHERWDGGGYPDGLAGDEIPLGARIVAVCDAFDAMVTDRPYRRGMTREDAIAELQRCSGTQFDPDVVEAFLASAATPVEEISLLSPTEAVRP